MVDSIIQNVDNIIKANDDVSSTQPHAAENLFDKTLQNFVVNFPEYEDDISRIVPIEEIKRYNRIEGTTVNEELTSQKIKYMFTFFYSRIKTLIAELFGFGVNPLRMYETFKLYADNQINEFELIQSFNNKTLSHMIRPKIESVKRSLTFIYETLLSDHDDRTLIYCLRNTSLETILRMSIRLKQEKNLDIKVNIDDVKCSFITEDDMIAWIQEDLVAHRLVLTKMIAFYEFMSMLISDGADVPNSDISSYKEECSDILYQALTLNILICNNKWEYKKIENRKTLRWLKL